MIKTRYDYEEYRHKELQNNFGHLGFFNTHLNSSTRVLHTAPVAMWLPGSFLSQVHPLKTKVA